MCFHPKKQEFPFSTGPAASHERDAEQNAPEDHEGHASVPHKGQVGDILEVRDVKGRAVLVFHYYRCHTKDDLRQLVRKVL